jgi:hypothetical protein
MVSWAVAKGMRMTFSAHTHPSAGEHGVIVTGVDPTGIIAADQGFELGDVILR